mgnify:CR=1 FL=1
MKKIAIALFSLINVLSFSANENIVRKIKDKIDKTDKK